MPKRNHHKDIDDVLRNWPYSAEEVRVRTVKASEGREVLQMRVELGVLQLETTNRPDGQRPGGFDTYLDQLLAEELHGGESGERPAELTDEQCVEIDREFMQFYHRRICWLQLGEYARAVDDADHTLALMDFVKRHSPNEEWTFSHEKYRPLVLFHRTHAAARAVLDGPTGAEGAISEINTGLQRIRDFFDADERFAEVEFDKLDFVEQLLELRETLRTEFKVGKTLDERLNDAIANEQYEEAAKLRDELRQREAR
jgi:hypothetical protein